MARSDVDAGPYRSRGVPLYVNSRGRWIGSFGYWSNAYRSVNRTVFALYPKDFRRISLKRMMRPRPSR